MQKIDMPMGNKSFHLIHIWPIGQGLLFCSFVFVRKGILSVWSEECSWKTCSTLEKGNRRESALINETTEARNKRVKLASISCYCTVYFCMFLCNTVFCAAKCFWKNCVPAWRMLSSSIRSSLDQLFPQNPLNHQNAPTRWLLVIYLQYIWWPTYAVIVICYHCQICFWIREDQNTLIVLFQTIFCKVIF